jgi:Zn-finger protein
MGVSKANQRCQCGASVLSEKNPVCYSLTMQLASVGGKLRVRSKGRTIYACRKCVRLIHTKVGRNLRKALAMALQSQAVELHRAEKVVYGLQR